YTEQMLTIQVKMLPRGCGETRETHRLAAAAALRCPRGGSKIAFKILIRRARDSDRAVPVYGDDLLAAPDRGGAGAGGGAMMDFYDVLAQVIALLQREGRTSYRALKRQFGLDDDYIEDRKEDLMEARRLAVDDPGRVWVWAGEVAATPAPPAASPPTPQPVTQEAPPPPVAPAPPDAERRQLTVLFCDLV